MEAACLAVEFGGLLRQKVSGYGTGAGEINGQGFLASRGTPYVVYKLSTGTLSIPRAPTL